MIRIIKYPRRDHWDTLIQRPQMASNDLDQLVQSIFHAVKTKGDQAILELTKKYDGIDLDHLKVSPEELANAEITQELKEAITLACDNIEKFHRAQISHEAKIETVEGVKCWRQHVAIDPIGLYIPGGSAPLFSTVLMLGIPATLARCQKIVLCTPADPDGHIHPAILYSAKKLGLTEIYKIGGAQAIAAMAYGTESIPLCHKIFGPGNQYVTKAKEVAQQYGTAIDMPAGPSEVLVIADRYSNPDFVASDLLAQAEHGPDSQVILLTDDEDLTLRVNNAVSSQISTLPRKSIIEKSLSHSHIILLESLDQCMDFSNLYAPEHLILNTQNNSDLESRVKNAGSVFIGAYSCESAGDYASGTNHTLPTHGYAKKYSGVSVDSFVKKITFQKLSAQGLQNIGPAIEVMATAEGLMAHKHAVSIRLKDIAS